MSSPESAWRLGIRQDGRFGSEVDDVAADLDGGKGLDGSRAVVPSAATATL
jgi:hypothetical protein